MVRAGGVHSLLAALAVEPAKLHSDASRMLQRVVANPVRHRTDSPSEIVLAVLDAFCEQCPGSTKLAREAGELLVQMRELRRATSSLSGC